MLIRLYSHTIMVTQIHGRRANLIHSEGCETFLSDRCSLCDPWVNTVSIPLGNAEAQNFKLSESETLGMEASKLRIRKSLP